MPHAAELVVVGEERVGIVGADVLGSPIFPNGDMLAVGIAGAELTPGLVISVESNGIPVWPTPLGLDAGLDDEAVLPEPEPHIPVVPDVSIIPEDVDIADGAETPDDDVDIPGIVIVTGVAVPVVTRLPVVAAVAGAAVPADVPPPS